MFALHEIEAEVWTFRYFDTVRHPLRHIEGRTTEDPEIALLYKAAPMREVDVQDFVKSYRILAGSCVCTWLGTSFVAGRSIRGLVYWNESSEVRAPRWASFAGLPTFSPGQ